ncbi:hypothetical protein ACFVWN_24185 [Nocardiopsis flavescens]|uniref:hypothetical protein n=1 Tax=Nocardiopsis flavescens TaxID=758803 RepID=UPI0036D809CA
MFSFPFPQPRGAPTRTPREGVPLRLERSFGPVEDTVLFRVEPILRRLLAL